MTYATRADMPSGISISLFPTQFASDKEIKVAQTSPIYYLKAVYLLQDNTICSSHIQGLTMR